MIAVDWGTSNFRAFRVSAEGSVFARASSPQGILRVGEGNFEEALRAEVGVWLAAGEKHVLLCGMIGSRQGWVEAEYLPCPVGIDELADAVVPVPFSGASVRLVPGVIGPDAAGVPELMRGEETAAMGMLDACAGAGLVCFPGTHSKWIQLSDRKIVSFTTCMTGELYGALRKCTILERTMTSNAAVDKTAFDSGIARSADPGGLLHHLFGVRTLPLMGQLKEEKSASYLSGLLIGHEVRATMPKGSHVHLVGAAHLCGLYAQVIEARGGVATMEDEDAAALGLAAIARRLHWT
ncbi:MAG: 2-dehydro-3-deoxygalactonokinase [Acidobacteriaceae bacterium]|nr:2-dehydro-3-deoxygalactonokinase [Acidobacteriaceae bacterium]